MPIGIYPHKSRPAADRFWEKVDKSGDCWIWQGSIMSTGYGSFNVGNRKQRTAHNVAYRLVVGDPGDLHVCHSCDVNYPRNDKSYRRCVRPSHLFLGSNAENTRDKVAKDRGFRGEDYRFRGGKLTNAIVLEIRARFEAGETQAALTRAYGLNCETVNGIVRRRYWKHI